MHSLQTAQKTLKPDDPFRIAMTEQLLDKLHNTGILTTTKSLQKAEENRNGPNENGAKSQNGSRRFW
jgi:hypothetical protein